MLDQNTIRAGFVRFEVGHWFTEMTGFSIRRVCLWFEQLATRMLEVFSHPAGLLLLLLSLLNKNKKGRVVDNAVWN